MTYISVTSRAIATIGLLFLVFIVSGCGPVTRLIPDGNAWIQKTVERNLFESNVVSERRCTELENGWCKEDGTQPKPSLAVVEAPGPRLVGAVLTTAGFLGSAAIITHGLQTQAVSPGTQVLNGSSISTLNACGTGPAFVGMKPAPGCK